MLWPACLDRLELRDADLERSSIGVLVASIEVVAHECAILAASEGGGHDHGRHDSTGMGIGSTTGMDGRRGDARRFVTGFVHAWSLLLLPCARYALCVALVARFFAAGLCVRARSGRFCWVDGTDGVNPIRRQQRQRENRRKQCGQATSTTSRWAGAPARRSDDLRRGSRADDADRR